MTRSATDAPRLFRQHFGQVPTHTVLAPGRLELLGNHTDYNQGLVLAAAVDRSVQMSVSPRSDGRIELISSAFAAPEQFSVHQITRNPAAPWADYIKGVLAELRRRSVRFTGFNAAVHGTIPPGAGLSSSAALEVATLLSVRLLHPHSLTRPPAPPPSAPRRKGEAPPPLPAAERLEMARVCHAAENGFVGVNCGLLDPICSLFGKAFHALEIDFQSLAIEQVPMIGEIALVVCPSGVQHALVDGGYNALRQLCESAARALQVKSLRSVDLPHLKTRQQRLSARQYACAFHVVAEIQRVVFGSRALREGDFEQFGQYMFQSHESSRDHFLNSCPELDLLVELARRHPACLGARLTGGGFGGATVNLIRREQRDAFVAHMAAGYAQGTGRTLEPLVCQAADGARQPHHTPV